MFDLLCELADLLDQGVTHLSLYGELYFLLSVLVLADEHDAFTCSHSFDFHILTFEFNLRKIFERKFDDRFTLEVIDIFEKPESAIEDDVMVIPTLVKFFPAPTRRVIGDFIEGEKVLKGLEIEPS